MSEWPYTHTPLSTFAGAWRREHAKTRDVLHAFPAGRADFKPHERSSPAAMLAWMFPLEETMMLLTLRGEGVLGRNLMTSPPPWNEILERFDAQAKELEAELTRIGDATLSHTQKFPVGPKQIAEWPASDFLWFMLHDQIHHRGQMSVYLRMAGGKVPAIYGPSADEKWF